jgi:Dolichyl-phosphate-mannose-protein mannosyltransferase
MQFDMHSAGMQAKSSREIYLWTFLLWAVLVSIDVWWIRHDRQPQGCDQAGHLIESINFARSIQSFSLRDLWHEWHGELGKQGEYTYPPLFHLITGIFICALGRPALAGVASNELFLWILLLSVIQIGKRAFNLAVGVLAAILVGLYSNLAQFRHEAFIDFALTGMTSWCAWQLVKTDGFRQRRTSAALGVSVGLALLLKQAVILFLALPVLFVIFRRRKEWDRERWTNFLIAAGAALLTALPWYGLHWRAVLANLALNQRVAAIEGDPMPWTFIGAIYYPWVMSCIQIGFPLFVLAIVAALMWLVKNKDGTTKEVHLTQGVIVTWIVGSIPLLTFLVMNKDARYSLPVLPAVALMTCSVVVWTRRRAAKIGWCVLLALCAFPYYTFVMFAWPPFHREIGFYTGRTHWLVWTDNYYFGAGPKQEDWHVPEILERMRLQLPHASNLNPIHIAVVPFLLRFNPNSLKLEALERGIPIQITPIGSDESLSTLDAMLSYDFLFTKTGDLGLPFETDRAKTIQDVVSLHPENFEAVATYEMPDHSTGVLYRIVRQEGTTGSGKRVNVMHLHEAN